VKPAFFKTPADFRRWLERHHDSARELLVGFYKVGSGRPSITWPQSVDQALCFGWIDGVRRRIDDESYTIRFTPRKPRSIWSAVNIRRATELKEQGLMQPAGLRAFEQRSPQRSAIYSYEKAPAELPAEAEAAFRKRKAAWAFFSAQAPSYRRVAVHWVTTAKKEETRARRLEKLIEASAEGRRLDQFTSTAASRRSSR
jgi:uncharacterized protein YdeI (YjbR/CyaY-like superfamily)